MGVEISIAADHVDECVAAMKSECFERMIEAVNEVRNTVLETLSGERSGSIYTVRGSPVSEAMATIIKGNDLYQIEPSALPSVGGSLGERRVYTASAPGEPPAVLTGRLRQGIAADVQYDIDTLVGRVGTDVDYGIHLEYGTSKMAPRPWLQVSFDKSQEAVRNIFERRSSL